MFIFYIIGLICFMMAIVFHETTHYTAATYYGYQSSFKFINAKEKKALGIFGKLPGTSMDIDIETLNKKKCFMIFVLPVFPTMFFLFFCIAMITYPSFSFNESYSIMKHVVWIAGSLIVGSLAALFGSRSDFKSYNKYKNIELGS